MFSKAAAAVIARRCVSSATTLRCCANVSSRALGLVAAHSPNHVHPSSNNNITRSFSSMPPPPTASPPTGVAQFQPPTSLTPEAGLGAQDAMKLFIEHGLGKQKLQQIATEKDTVPFVERWQKMVATYIETQCHVIHLLGYKPDEHGIATYTQQLMQAMQLSSPEVQEKLRVGGRDTYRMVLGAAFNIPTLIQEQEEKGELSIVDARNIMHKVSIRMQEPEVLESVAKQCSVSVAMNDSEEAKQIELARKHTVVQEVMVKDVYMAKTTEGGVSLVEECGFGAGEDGYVRMQSAMAEHQSDPLINQYVGASMVKLLQSAGIDMEALQKGQQQ